MSDAFTQFSPRTLHVRRSRGIGLGAFIVVTSMIFAGMARATAPKPFALAMMILVLTIAAWAVKPMVGLCATVLLALTADNTTASWYPFVKGFSAHESILFLSNGVIISPMELVLSCAILALIGRYLVLGEWTLSIGRLPFAMAGFLLFVVYGFLHGYSTGADTNIALYETRPFFALALVYILVSSVCRTLDHYRYLLWSVIAAIVVHALISLLYFSTLDADAFEQSESLIDHAPVMRMDILIVVTMLAWMFGTSRRLRWTLTVLTVPVVYVYLLSERRAAVIGLVGALGLTAVVLFWHRRRMFFKIVPIAALVLAGYTGAFWNSTGAAAFPAQAVKSVISPTDVSSRNQSSDQYRIVENLDLAYTIQTSRLKGIGLGQPFYRPYPLPALASTFKLALYLPHNSFLWIWMTLGFGGFATMIYLVGRAVSVGAAKVRTWASGTELVVLLAFVLAVVTFTVFSYVDIAWDVGNMTFLGAAIAVCGSYPSRNALSLDDERLTDPPVEAPVARRERAVSLVRDGGRR